MKNEASTTIEGYGHIDQVPNKRADTLIHLTAPDPYHKSIQTGAATLVASGRGDWKHRTQWGSGATCWGKPDDSANTTISADGIEKN